MLDFYAELGNSLTFQFLSWRRGVLRFILPDCILLHLIAPCCGSFRVIARLCTKSAGRRAEETPGSAAGAGRVGRYRLALSGGRRPPADGSGCGPLKLRSPPRAAHGSAARPFCWVSGVSLSPAVFLVCISLAGCVSGVYLSRRLCFWCVSLSPAVFLVCVSLAGCVSVTVCPSRRFSFRCVSLAGFLFVVSPSPVFFSACLSRRFSFRCLPRRLCFRRVSPGLSGVLGPPAPSTAGATGTRSRRPAQNRAPRAPLGQAARGSRVGPVGRHRDHARDRARSRRDRGGITSWPPGIAGPRAWRLGGVPEGLEQVLR